MNSVILSGRLCGDPEIRRTEGQNPITIARYRLAVSRYKGDEADFINCVAFRERGEFAEKYLHKGTKLIIAGRLQTGSYTNKDGQKVYTTDVIVESQEFAESKNSANKAASGGFVDVPDDDMEELPFH